MVQECTLLVIQGFDIAVVLNEELGCLGFALNSSTLPTSYEDDWAVLQTYVEWGLFGVVAFGSRAMRFDQCINQSDKAIRRGVVKCILAKLQQ